MYKKNYVLFYLSFILFFSCNANKRTIASSDEILQQETKNEGFDIHDDVGEIEIMKAFVYENDEYIKKRNFDITFIAKANFGIPQGDNWLVRINNVEEGILIYAIKDNRIEKDYYLTSFNLENHSNFNIMQNIPGTLISNSTSSFGDFNGDGIDEIFQYAFGGNALLVSIRGYDTEKDDFVSYTLNTWIPFRIIDPENGPAPVEFMTYNGMYGFKVFFYQLELAGGPGWVPNPNPKNGKWIFYTWDAEKREYVEVGEVVEE